MTITAHSFISLIVRILSLIVRILPTKTATAMAEILTLISNLLSAKKGGNNQADDYREKKA